MYSVLMFMVWVVFINVLIFLGVLMLGLKVFIYRLCILLFGVLGVFLVGLGSGWGVGCGLFLGFL